VSRLGQQGDGAGPESTNRFYEGEGCKNAQRDPQAALARNLAYVVVAMIMVTAMIMAWAGVSMRPLPAWRLNGSVSIGGHADALLIGTPGADSRRNVVRGKIPASSPARAPPNGRGRWHFGISATAAP
jgi:hypothetical protein